MVKVLPPKPKRTTFEREGRRPRVDKAEEWRKKRQSWNLDRNDESEMGIGTRGGLSVDGWRRGGKSADFVFKLECRPSLKNFRLSKELREWRVFSSFLETDAKDIGRNS